MIDKTWFLIRGRKQFFLKRTTEKPIITNSRIFLTQDEIVKIASYLNKSNVNELEDLVIKDTQEEYNAFEQSFRNKQKEIAKLAPELIDKNANLEIPCYFKGDYSLIVDNRTGRIYPASRKYSRGHEFGTSTPHNVCVNYATKKEFFDTADELGNIQGRQHYIDYKTRELYDYWMNRVKEIYKDQLDRYLKEN